MSAPRAWLRWLRSPLPHGGPLSTFVCLAVFVVAIGVTILDPFGQETSLRAGVSSAGLIGLCLGLGRPRFFWNSGVLEGWRWFFGDRGVVLIYTLLGLGLTIGAWTGTLNPDAIPVD